MLDSNEEPTETSPLLRKSTNAHPQRADVSNGALPNDIDGQTKDVVRSDADEESQNTVTEYQGIPELKAKLKYIMPALAIGIFLSAADQTLIVTMYGKIGSDLKALNKTSWVSTA